MQFFHLTQKESSRTDMESENNNWSEKLIQESLIISPVNETIATTIKTHLSGVFQQNTLASNEIKKITQSLLKMMNESTMNDPSA